MRLIHPTGTLDGLCTESLLAHHEAFLAWLLDRAVACR
jgi:hypothetical protein